MCCFNRPVEHVSDTKIFVMPTKTGRQITIYQNELEASGDPNRTVIPPKKLTAEMVAGIFDRSGGSRSGAGQQPPPPMPEKKEKEAQEKSHDPVSTEKYGNAMILPCPLKAGHDVELIDLSKDTFSFARLKAWFPAPPSARSVNKSDEKRAPTQQQQAPLQVHAVGAYFISVAKELADLRRVDPAVFKVSDNIENVFSKHYSVGFGFIICCFDPSKKLSPHPVGYLHDLLPDGRMFVPTRHEHGGSEEKTMEHFDHAIYSANTAPGESGQTKADMLGDRPAIEPPKPTKTLVLKAVQSEAGVIKCKALETHLPEITSLRQRLIRGMYKNDDLVFALAS